MSTVVICPGCGIRLKVPLDAAGKSVWCLKCAKIIAAEEPTPLPLPSSIEDLSEEVHDDDERTRSRRRAKNDDNDDEPRSRRRAKNDDNDDEPRSRRRAKNDDNDDEPRSRRRAKDVDDDDDEPRSRRQAKDDDSKLPRKTILIAIGTLFIGLFLGAGVLITIRAMGQGNSGNEQISDQEKRDANRVQTLERDFEVAKARANAPFRMRDARENAIDAEQSVQARKRMQDIQVEYGMIVAKYPKWHKPARLPE
jgi:hypothetical protein